MGNNISTIIYYFTEVFHVFVFKILCTLPNHIDNQRLSKSLIQLQKMIELAQGFIQP